MQSKEKIRKIIVGIVSEKETSDKVIDKAVEEIMKIIFENTYGETRRPVYDSYGQFTGSWHD